MVLLSYSLELKLGYDSNVAVPCYNPARMSQSDLQINMAADGVHLFVVFEIETTGDCFKNFRSRMAVAVTEFVCVHEGLRVRLEGFFEGFFCFKIASKAGG